MMAKKAAKKSERDIIEHIIDLVGIPENEGIIKGIGDDCTVLRKDKNNCYLVTTDTLVAGVHFDLRWHPPHLLGRKSGAVNLSDIAAMGGRPRFALLNVVLPGSAPGWLDDFLAGLHGMLREHGTTLVGGDTVKSLHDLSITVTIIGEATEDIICYRSGAAAGDLVFVSGPLGNAAAGLALCRAGMGKEHEEIWEEFVKAHLDPQPQIELGSMLAASGLVHAMMDISDGLATDLAHICAASDVGAVINRKDLPVSRQLERAAAVLQNNDMDWVLKGGEDYHLLFTVPPGNEQELRSQVRSVIGQEIYCVGEIVGGRGVVLADGPTRQEISFKGYDHFAE